MEQRHLGRLAAVFLLALTGLGLLFSVSDAQTTPAATPSPMSKDLPGNLFANWPQGKTPDVVLVLSGQQHSYLKFCGCTAPQYGGFERRYNFVAKLKEKGWPVVALDLGDLTKPKTAEDKNIVPYLHDQTILKYSAAMKALNALNYSAIGIGQLDLNLPLIEGLYTADERKPPSTPRMLAANMENRAIKFPTEDNGSWIGDLIVVPGKNGTPSVGVTAVIAPSIREKITDKLITFADNNNVIPDAVKEFEKQKAGLRVLLYQGTPQQAKVVAEKFTDFDVILASSMEEEPPSAPMVVGKTMIVTVGWRGRYVGVVGAFRKPGGNDFELHYQLVRMEPEFDTDADKEKGHPILEILQEYAENVKKDDLRSKFPKVTHPLQTQFPQAKVTYIGSDQCKQCHEKEYQIWKKSPHSHAWDTLVNKAVKPTLRQFDGECVVCHVVGFEYDIGFKDDVKTKHLLNVGCESCHGPGSLHAAQKDNKDLQLRMSPWKQSKGDYLYTKPDKYDTNVLNKVDQMCAKCHDQDNDPNFRFEKRWPLIDHSRRGFPPPKPPKN